jgi:glycosyltransferase involved in cell wall biosynthesis
MSFPKVLIFGQPFNDFSGGGITLTNLFKGWPKERIGVMYMGHGLTNITTDVCNIYYQLGTSEHKWIFPFNLIQRKFPSGIKDENKTSNSFVSSSKGGIRFKLVNQFFYPLLRWIGLFHIVSRIIISENLKSWLSEFKPEILYLQASTREDISFSEALIKFLKIPSAIHVMDDWPLAITNTGLFRNFWRRKIHNEFSHLLNQIDLCLSISDAMSAEYLRRYDKKFIPFHNPIEIERWLPYTKKDLKINKEFIKILYSGRLGDNGISDSLLEFAEAVNTMNEKDNTSIKFHIQTPTARAPVLAKLRQIGCVVINPFASYNQIPAIFSEADILLLANDFNKTGIDYLKLSMPTKASEYMISGTPVLVYTPGSAAVSMFFSSNDCGCCVNEQDRDIIITAVKCMVDNEEYRRSLSNNAIKLAKERFDARKVRNDFQSLLFNLIN